MFTINHVHKKILQTLFILTLMSLGAAAHATLTASVDRNNISLQETFTLTVKADEQTRDTPDFSTLENDFEVLGKQSRSSVQIINGNAESSTEWILTLAPKHVGTLLIPSFNKANAVSDAIEISVTQQSQTQTGSNEQVYVTVESNKKSAFVQEQVLIKIKLITEVNLSQAEMQPLELKNALVVNLDQQQYQTNINGKAHLIVETIFAIFPQESGDIVIPSLNYNVAVDNSRNGWGDPFGRNRNNILRLRTTEQHIIVKAVPSQVTQKNWQPANQLTLSENWSNSIDHLKVGEPVTRTITINADGLTGGQILPLTSTALDGLTFYPDQAQTKDNKSANGVQGSRVETTAIVPNRSGDFTLPEITVEWWNINTQTLQTATLPAKTIYVTGDALTALPQLPAQQNSTTNANANNSTETNKTIAPTLLIPNTLNPWLWAASIFFALVSLSLAVYVWHLRARLFEWQAAQEKADFAVSENEKNIWRALQQAAAHKNAPALRKAILNWAKDQWPETQINTLDEITKLALNEDLTAALKQLDAWIYSSHTTTECDTHRLLTLLKECKKEQKREGKNKKIAAELKSLYADN